VPPLAVHPAQTTLPPAPAVPLAPPVRLAPPAPPLPPPAVATPPWPLALLPPVLNVVLPPAPPAAPLPLVPPAPLFPPLNVPVPAEPRELPSLPAQPRADPATDPNKNKTKERFDVSMAAHRFLSGQGGAKKFLFGSTRRRRGAGRHCFDECSRVHAWWSVSCSVGRSRQY
jgi:hypothetical protein